MSAAFSLRCNAEQRASQEKVNNVVDISCVTRRAMMRAAVAALAMPAILGAVGPARASANAFRAIRYARAERFGPAEVEPFDDRLISGDRGPIGPQFRSRLAFALGDQAPLPQDEHCQYLSVFTPARTGKRPVIVFLHGGAFVSGGGELPWYDGDSLAIEQDIVVVTVTYRLGAFGYWLPEGSTGPSPAMTDQIAALRWIQANIARFGGDPDNVTLAGQSAGSATAIQLVDWGHGGTLFHRIIAMSGGRQKAVREALEANSRSLDKLLGSDPRTAPVFAILAAQKQLPTAGPDGEHSWQPVRPDHKAAINVDVMAGWTREDPAAGMAMAAGGALVPGTPLGPYREANKPQISAATAYAQEVAAAGHNAFLYSFDWNGPDTGLGNCHCIDLSFLFGDRAAWESAPMLRGTNWTDHSRLAKTIRSHWGAFARAGNPSAGGAKWSPVSAGAAPVFSLA